ncbi:hypothetical protein [Kosakonia sacchari]|uniref:Uncharacterized protein n=1 Tax=Kosakonia sacchari TaxID=1158459 RepID=A0A1G4YMQ7_9ENTR|nr:hypothetical protein [Kosakonia sacchari]AHJ75073.1 hypothetical protein C813_10265 [Kosakonia sacchari SP1]NUL38853.1 hypothetical protein [Kosakonia sacchari]SCX54782.1 hypothetical protein SAMN02927897_03043 [Kosakonia sacchari]
MEKKNSTDAERTWPVEDNPFWLHVEMQVQKWGAIVLIAIVIAGLCGLFSQGLLSKKTVTSADQRLSVEYDRFGRLQSDLDMQITANATTDNRITFTLGGDFMHDFEIRTLQPQPLNMYSRSGELVLEYARPATDKPLTVWLGLTPLGVGNSTQRIAVNNATPVTLTQFIWP